MKRDIALKKLQKLLGKNMGYRVDPDAPDADGRAEAKVERARVAADAAELKLKLDRRREELLSADPEYVRWRELHKAARDRADRLTGMQHHYRFTVGISGEHFFTVRAQGDSWEEVIAKLEKETRR